MKERKGQLFVSMRAWMNLKFGLRIMRPSFKIFTTQMKRSILALTKYQHKINRTNPDKLNLKPTHLMINIKNIKPTTKSILKSSKWYNWRYNQQCTVSFHFSFTISFWSPSRSPSAAGSSLSILLRCP